MLRVGIIGAGANTRSRHIPELRGLPDVEITAVANRSPESSRAAASALAIPTACDDWRQLVRSDQVDAVLIGTWPYLHCEATLEALACGKHVLTEARLAGDLAEARRMLEASRASDRVAMVVPAPFWLESEPELLARIEDGWLGEVLEVHVRGLGGAHDPAAPIHWRQRRDRSGKNILMLGILNETVRRYVGDDRAVVAQGRIAVPERMDSESGKPRAVDVPDSLGVVSELASGGVAVYHLSGVACHGGGPAIEIHGTRGAIFLDEGGVRVARGVGSRPETLHVPPERRGGWRVEAEWIAAIRDGTPVTRTSFTDAERYMAFTEAVHESLESGRRVEISPPPV